MYRLKIRELEVFAAYMKSGSVTQTARELNTTQPNASKILKNIEIELGVVLFSRRNGKLRPTPEAELLYEHVQRFFHQLAVIETFGEDSNLARRPSLRVATLATYGSALLPMAVEKFRRSHPDLQLLIDVLDGEKIYTMVGQGLYDFGFVHFPLNQGDITSETLVSSGIHCLVPADHALAKLSRIEPADLAHEPIVTYGGTVQLGSVIAKAFLDNHLTMNHAVATNHSQVVRKFVERGHGIGLVDPFSVVDLEPGGALRAIVFHPEIMISLGVIKPMRRPLSKLAEEFIAVVRAVSLNTSGARNC
ncbi:MAG: LysR family transcriptional regulator [Shinella sp.]|nr:MAG: LysR family transcriptional regulator [Shinella sp.]